jgi:hypothetical protein
MLPHLLTMFSRPQTADHLYLNCAGEIIKVNREAAGSSALLQRLRNEGEGCSSAAAVPVELSADAVKAWSDGVDACKSLSQAFEAVEVC